MQFVHRSLTGPWAFDVIGSDNVVGGVFERAVFSLDISVYEPKFAAIMRQARRPYTCTAVKNRTNTICVGVMDTATIGIAPHIQLTSSCQRAYHELPVGQVF
jgi:hypothetical protein